MAEEPQDYFKGMLIHTYTRAEALADGELVDVSKVAAEAGFKPPVAVSRRVWEDCIAWGDVMVMEGNTGVTKAPPVHQDESGRLWDVVWMASHAARNNKSARRVDFELYRVPRDGKSTQAELVKLILDVGPGDQGEPVVTIMMPGDD